MLGGMLAGHEESGGKLIEKDGKKYKVFYGMSSQAAMETGIWNKSIGVHLRLTRKQARAVADAHYDCCMQ